jgi:hypothetical protein
VRAAAGGCEGGGVAVEVVAEGRLAGPGKVISCWS